MAVLPGRAGHPGVLRRRPDRPHRRPLHGHRVLALLGRPPVGGGLPGALHHRDGGLHVRAARRGARADRARRDLPGHHPLLVRRRHRHDAPPVLLRRAGRAHGARRLLLGRRGHPAHLPDRRGVVVPPARLRAGVALADALPAPLGGHVPRRGRLLELPRRRDLRLPDQPAGGLLLRDRHRADGQPRPRGDDGRLRDARHRAGALLPALPDPGRPVARAVGADLVLGDEHRARLDVLRHPAAARHRAALRVRGQGLLGGARAGVPDQRHERAAGVAAPPRRHRVHRRRRGPRALHRLPRHPPHRPQRHARRARGHPVHRDPRARGRGGDRRGRGDRGEDATDEPRGPAGRRVRRVPPDRRRPPGVALGADPPAVAALPHGRLPLRRAARPLALPRGPAPVAARVRPRAPPRALPRQGAHLQRLPAQGGLHGLRRGREIVRAVDPWPHSEAGRFHRGLSLLLVVLAGLVLRRRRACATTTPPRRRCSAGCSLAAALAGRALARDFRAHPANFPAAARPTGFGS